MATKKKEGFQFSMALAFVLIALILLLPFLLYNNLNNFAPLNIKTINPQDLLTLFGSLFFIALLVERFLEVFFVDNKRLEKKSLEKDIDSLEEDVDVIRKNPQNHIITSKHVIKSRSLVLPSMELESLNPVDRVADLSAAKDQLAGDLSKMKEERRKRMHRISLIIGLLLAFFGVRILGNLITDFEALNEIQKGYVSAVDMILTAGLIAGGSETIHGIISRITSFSER